MQITHGKTASAWQLMQVSELASSPPYSDFKLPFKSQSLASTMNQFNLFHPSSNQFVNLLISFLDLTLPNIDPLLFVCYLNCLC